MRGWRCSNLHQVILIFRSRGYPNFNTKGYFDSPQQYEAAPPRRFLSLERIQLLVKCLNPQNRGVFSQFAGRFPFGYSHWVDKVGSLSGLTWTPFQIVIQCPPSTFRRTLSTTEDWDTLWAFIKPIVQSTPRQDDQSWRDSFLNCQKTFSFPNI